MFTQHFFFLQKLFKLATITVNTGITLSWEILAHSTKYVMDLRKLIKCCKYPSKKCFLFGSWCLIHEAFDMPPEEEIKRRRVRGAGWPINWIFSSDPMLGMCHLVCHILEEKSLQVLHLVASTTDNAWQVVHFLTVLEERLIWRPFTSPHSNVVAEKHLHHFIVYRTKCLIAK